MKRSLILFPLLLLMGQNCDPPKQEPDPGATDYCYGNDYSVLSAVTYGYEQDGVSGALSAILRGEPSEDRRATVQVLFGSAYCSGVALTPNTVLTAAHCGYGASTTHRIRTGEDGKDYHSTTKLIHPDYLNYINGGDLDARKADLMLLYMDDPLPPPYVNTIYTSLLRKVCRGLVAQGWGRSELPGANLREAKYIITQESDKLLTSRLAPEGKICFGDSGGPLYADVAGSPQLAGITTTTMSQDCLVGGNHVKVAAFQGWVEENTRP